MPEMPESDARNLQLQVLEGLGDEYAIDMPQGSFDPYWCVYKHKDGMQFTSRIDPYRHLGKMAFSVHCPRSRTGDSMRFKDWNEPELPSIYIAATKPASRIAKELRARLLEQALPIIKRIGEKRETQKSEADLNRTSFLKVVQCIGVSPEDVRNTAHLEESSFLTNDIHVRVRLCGSYKLEIDYLTEEEAIRILTCVNNLAGKEEDL